MTTESYCRKNDLTFKEANELFTYSGGQLFWKARGKSRRYKKPVGWEAPNGYLRVEIARRTYAVHRIIWVMHGNQPAETIDHINGNVTDNRIENLRAATQAQNCMNRRQRYDNKSGVKGVHWDKNKKKWIAGVTLNGRLHYAGYFDCKSEAANAVAALRQQLHGEFTRHS